MAFVLLLLFIGLPLLDLFLLIKLAGILGLLPTIGLVVVTGLVGVGLIQREGLTVLLRLQRAVFVDEMQQTMLEGALLVGGGIMLLSPGVVTDIVGLSLVAPWTRPRVATRLRGWMERSDAVRFEVRTIQ